MKRSLFAVIALCGALGVFAQADSTVKEQPSDTIRVGGMVIVKKGGGKKYHDLIISNREKRRLSNLSTNWWIFDVGFANYNDKTNYASPEAVAFAPGTSKEALKLKSGKSVNVNIWVFMQRLNIIKHVVNLKYGLGLELNNYRYEYMTVRLHKDPSSITADQAIKETGKNKLAADYVTAPILLNFNFTPHRHKGFGFSAGISAGYLYSARQKIKINGNKSKLHDDFNLEKWKLSYIGEFNLGIVKLYGSYAFKSMWEKGLDQTPYSVGLRFGSW
jgi:hypothetical protein